MPIYEYECTKCGCQTEALQKFSDPPISECEACGGKMKKLMSHNTFHLKGSGWYVTDYASKSGGNQGYNKVKSDTRASGDKSETSQEPSARKNAPSKGSTETSNKKVSPDV